MMKYADIVSHSYRDYWNYLSHEILHPSWHNYFYWLIGISLTCWLIEIIFPWRKNQSIIRKDFFLDGFYMFFNFFLFSLIGFFAITNVGVDLFNRFIGLFGISNLAALQVQSLPTWSQLLILFVVNDFVSWNVHRLLHRVPWMWEFHKVHHSVEEMGFAAHLRYHWMENIIYKTIQYIPLAMIGFGLQDFFIVHIISLSIGHLNHTNLNLSYGPLKYLINNPVMHIWHHSKVLPPEKPYGVNYGISLSIWDYLFRTNYIPSNGRDIPLGFQKMESFPKKLFGQMIYPVNKKKI